MNNGEPFSTMPKRLPPSPRDHGRHLGQQVHQEEHRAIADARQAGAEAAVEALLSCSGARPFDLFPFHAEGRVGQHVVELTAAVAVVAERIAGDDVGHVLALDEHVGLADGVDSSLSSWPYIVSRACGLCSERYSPAIESMPPVPAVGS